jgi:hypothetical protein
MERQMIRRQIYLTENQIADLKEFSQEFGISMSECIRRVIDHHIKRKKEGLPSGFGEETKK